MIDPDYLLWEPHEALTHREPGAPNQTFLRRAVSNFYYALFYRALEHGGARKTFERVSRDQAASAEARSIAKAFLVLQQARHSAGYDPVERFYVSDAKSLFQEAEAAIETLRAGFSDKAEILARLIFKERS